MHSRSTAPCTSLNSASSLLAADVVPPAEASCERGMIMPTRRSSRRSSTPISVAAICYERGFVGLQLAGDDLLQPLRLADYGCTQLAETEHAERVADLPEHLDLRAQLLRLTRATAHEDVEDVFDLAEILANRSGNGLHQLHRWVRKVLALLLHCLIDWQQLGEAERRAHGADARPEVSARPT